MQKAAVGLLRPAVSACAGYDSPGPSGDGWVMMNDNTSPYGPSSGVVELLKRPAVEVLGGLDACFSYPDQYSDRLRSAIADAEGVLPECVTVGNGADDILDIVIRSFAGEGDTVALPSPYYSMYGMIAGMAGANVVTPFMGRPPSLEGLTGMKEKVLIISNPHNPTGIRFPDSEVVRLLGGSEGIVVIDEAYAEFSGSGLSRLPESYGNAILVRTFSKIHGLAGLRIGYSISSPDVASVLNRVKLPYNVNCFSQRVALEAMRDRNHVETVRREVNGERERIASFLGGLGVAVFDSGANFVLMQLGEDADRVFSELMKRRILTRRIGQEGYADCIRVTVRTGAENDSFLKAMSAIMGASS